jgi:hypothetical protein
MEILSLTLDLHDSTFKAAFIISLDVMGTFMAYSFALEKELYRPS